MTLPLINAGKVLGWLRDPAHRKWVLATVTVVLVVAALLFARHWRSEALEARVDAEVAQNGVEVLEGARRADSNAQANLEASRTAIAEDEKKHRAETEDALRRHGDWANEPVPDDVLGSLLN